MTIFITGVTSFSGARLLSHMLAAGHRVTANLRRPDPALEAMAVADDHLELVVGDLVDLERLPDGIETVIHAAATSPAPGITDEKIMRDNADATENLVRLAADAGVERFVFFSSLSVYGDIAIDVVDENTPIADPGAYGRSKLVGEAALKNVAGEMASVALRLPAVLGRGTARHWLSGMLEKARGGEDIRIFNADGPFNNAVHIDDLCTLIGGILSMPPPGFDAITLGAAGTMTIRDVAATVVEATGSASNIIVEPESRQSFLVSNERVSRLYAYTPAGIRDSIDRYLSESLA